MNLAAHLVALSGAGMIAYGIAFLVRNFTGFIELGLTAELVGSTPEAIAAFSPRLYNYISHLHVAVAALIMGLGIAVMALAWFGIRRGLRWAVWTAFAAPASAFVLMLPIHHVHGLATLGHVGPGYVALLALTVGTVLAHRVMTRKP